MPKRSPDDMAETHERILAAVARLAVQRGFAGFTVSDICREAWLSPGAIYTHYTGMDDLIGSCTRWHGELALHRRLIDQMYAEGDPLERLDLLVRRHLDVYGGLWGYEHCAMDVATWGEYLRNPRNAEAYVEDVARLLVTAYRLVRQGQREGQFERHLFAPAAAQAIAAMLLGLCLLRRLGWRYTPRRMGDAVAVLLRGLAAPGPAAG